MGNINSTQRKKVDPHVRLPSVIRRLTSKVRATVGRVTTSPAPELLATPPLAEMLSQAADAVDEHICLGSPDDRTETAAPHA